MLDVIVLVVGGLLAIVSFPSEVFPSGLPLLGLVILAPLFWFASRQSPWKSALAGGAWVVIVTLGAEGWLGGFHPLALPLVLLFQVPFYAAALAWISWLLRSRPKAGPWLTACAWTAVEFLRLQGFFCYPYHSVASSQWSWPWLYQSADLVGSSGITFLAAWTSAWLVLRLQPSGLSRRRRWLDLAGGITLWCLNLTYSAIHLLAPDSGELWRPALVQQAQDPWRGGPEAYSSALDQLIELSKRAEVSRPDVVVWSETAFVPSVEYHARYHENPNSLRLVRRLEDYLSTSTIPYIVGNDHREKRGLESTVDFNASLLWDSGWKGRYEKQRLVPFTESFPFREQLPWVYDRLREADTHFWEAGTDQEPLTVRGVRVGTPICFEDAFPEVGRTFALQGARALVNLTNDAWAGGTASRMQHLSLAAFRAVETRLPLVRAANDGATAAISRRGELLGILPIGPAGVLTAAVHLGDGRPSLYTLWGDWFAVVLLFIAVAFTVPWRRLSTIVDKGH